MNHNHKDFHGQVVDALSPEMQHQWAVLMEKCFTRHAKRFGPAAAMSTGGKELGEPSPPPALTLAAPLSRPAPSSSSTSSVMRSFVKNVDFSTRYTCVACGEMVVGKKLLDHLAEAHRKDCRPHTCGECGYQSITQCKVRLHISSKHPERAEAVEVTQQSSTGANFALFVERFFPEIPGRLFG